MCDEEDESLDTTLWSLEMQGIIPGTPVNKERVQSIATKPQDNTVLEDGDIQEDWEGGDEEDYWLSQTLLVQEIRGAGDVLPGSTGGVTSTPGSQKPSPVITVSEEDDLKEVEDDRNEDQGVVEDDDVFWKDPLSFLSKGSYPGPSQEDVKESRLVTIRTSQEDVEGDPVLYQGSHSSITLEERAVETAPTLTTTDQASVSGLNGAEIVGPFVGVGNKMVEGQDAIDPQHCVMSCQESHSLDDVIAVEEGYTRKPSSNTEPSIGGLEKRRDDDQAQPHVPIVTTHTKLQQVQRSASAKYYFSSPPPRAKKVTSNGDVRKKDEMVVKSGTPVEHQKDAPDDKKKSRRPSSLTSGRERCVHAKGGICQVHGPGARYTWKPIFIKEVGPDGEISVVKSKEWFYICDISQDNKKLKQTKISFMKTTSTQKTTLSVKDKIPDIKVDNDALQQGERFCDITTTNSEGTTTTLCEDKGEHHGETGDEK